MTQTGSRHGGRPSSLWELLGGPSPSAGSDQLPDPPADLPWDVRERERRKLAWTRRQGLEYLPWATLREQLDGDGVYYHDAYGYAWPSATGALILDVARRRIMRTGCSRIEVVLRLPGLPTPPDRTVWRLRGTDENGRGLVEGGREDEFDWGYLVNRVAGAEPLTVAALTRAGLRREVKAAIVRRLAANSSSMVGSAVLEALPVVTAAFCCTYAELQGLEAEEPLARWVAGNHAGEAFDQAYGLGRIRAAGIDPDAHPEFRRYQTYHDLGLPPPTHAEMTDEIIRRFGT